MKSCGNCWNGFSFLNTLIALTKAAHLLPLCTHTHTKVEIDSRKSIYYQKCSTVYSTPPALLSPLILNQNAGNLSSIVIVRRECNFGRHWGKKSFVDKHLSKRVKNSLPKAIKMNMRNTIVSSHTHAHTYTYHTHVGFYIQSVFPHFWY